VPPDLKARILRLLLFDGLPNRFPSSACSVLTPFHGDGCNFSCCIRSVPEIVSGGNYLSIVTKIVLAFSLPKVAVCHAAPVERPTDASVFGHYSRLDLLAASISDGLTRLNKRFVRHAASGLETF
jgi:hypothetical protein